MNDDLQFMIRETEAEIKELESLACMFSDAFRYDDEARLHLISIKKLELQELLS